MGYAPNPVFILPFGILLCAMALGPLWFPHWWERHYPKAAFGLGAITLGYYLLGLPGAALDTVGRTVHEYVSFVVLMGSLYVVSGGIHINVKGESRPAANTLFLFIGAVLANILGTTGASMLLIRPWLRMNRYRVTAHHVVFFIFLVSNAGGCLTPIGDPPLFLGYLRGIPFWWVLEHCWPMWLAGVAALLAIFYVFDRINYSRAPKEIRQREDAIPDVWRFEGLPNLAFLAVILCAVFLEHPLFLREAVMIAAAVGSYLLTNKSIHAANEFNFHPIREVAILFVGIFATMMPALDWLQANAQSILGDHPVAGLFFWGSGSLSSVLDNAPTYLAFLSALGGVFVNQDTVQQVQHVLAQGGDLSAAAEPIRNTVDAVHKYFYASTATREQIETAFILGNAKLNLYLIAISVGSVFFGACTYIGNGPNFMVKSIAHQRKVRCPGFLGYVFKWTLPVMLPVLLLLWLVFFRP